MRNNLTADFLIRSGGENSALSLSTLVSVGEVPRCLQEAAKFPFEFATSCAVEPDLQKTL